MPRKKTRDPIKGEILDGMLRNEITAEAMAEALNISRSKFYRMLKEHTDNWPLGMVKTAFKCCGMELSFYVKE